MVNHAVKIIKWIPVSDLSSEYLVESMCDDEHGFKIILMQYPEKKHTVIIRFHYSVCSYRISIGNTPPFNCNKWSFFQAINSDYFSWASQRSNKISEHLSLIHYLIFTKKEIIEILDAAEPSIEIIKNI